MLQRTLSEEENADFEKAVDKRYPLQDGPVPAPVGDGRGARRGPRHGCSRPPPGYGLLLRLSEVRYERGERRAFRYA